MLRSRLSALLVAAVMAAHCDRPEPAKAIRRTSALAATAAPKPDSGRIVHFAGGSVRVTLENDVDHAIVLDPAGQLVLETWCDHTEAPYDSLSAFFTRFRSAVIAGDRQAVANDIAYPLQVNGRTKSWMVATREDLVASYDRVFPPRVADSIRAAAPEVVFCRNYVAAMLGNGVVWAESEGAHPRVAYVNQ